jgi:NADH-quinone oxidoreductase subunit L
MIMSLTEVYNINPYFTLVPLVIIFPFLGIVISLVFGKMMKQMVVGSIASIASGLAFVVTLFLLSAELSYGQPVNVHVIDWITVGSFTASWSFRVDTLSIVMMLVVSGVGTLIHVYAIGYMYNDVRFNEDPGRYRRFFVYFNLFILAMMLLVSADNYLLLFVGWEGVGLCSYLLIGFWFEKGPGGTYNAFAGKKAFIVNRIGDFGILIALFLIFGAFGTFSFDTIFSNASQLTQGMALAITMFLLLGVTGKSAQLPLYVWLPDAMAGPTPVSALIHAATMVTAGVYLVVRSSALYAMSPIASGFVAWIGALSAVFAATIAIAQFDIKRVLAYSTISQIGYMIAAAGLGAASAAIFHLISHAFFKALLFLSAGSVIQAMERGEEKAGHGGEELDPQDMRNMGGLWNRIPLTFWVYLIGALALAGIAPLAGFFSKDEIITNANSVNPGIFALLVAGEFLTAFYAFRQIFMVFFGKSRTGAAENVSESKPVMTVPLVALAFCAAVGGAINFPTVGSLTSWLEKTVHHILEAPFNGFSTGLALGLAVLGVIVAWAVYGRRSLGAPDTPDPISKTLGWLFVAMNRKWWVDEFYHLIIVRPYNFLSQLFFGQWIDREVIDGAANNIGGTTRFFSGLISKLESGYLRTYAMAMLLGGVIILVYFVFR